LRRSQWQEATMRGLTLALTVGLNCWAVGVLVNQQTAEAQAITCQALLADLSQQVTLWKSNADDQVRNFSQPSTRELKLRAEGVSSGLVLVLDAINQKIRFCP
jgi:hypothetical protein